MGKKQHSIVLSAIIFTSIFAAVAMILSLLFAAASVRYAIPLLLLSFMLSLLIWRRFPLRASIPLPVYLISLLMAVLVAHPLLIIHPYVDASADPAPVIASLAIGTALPQTYAPYADLTYVYQLGLPLFAKLFIDVLPLEPHLIVWFIAVVFAAFQPIFLYLLICRLSHSDAAGVLGATMLVGTKIVFQALFRGEYAWPVASAMMLLFLTMFFERHPLRYLFFPAIILLHPGVAFNTILFLGVYVLFFRQELVYTLTLLPTLMVTVPALLITYFSPVTTLASQDLTLAPLPHLYRTLPLFVGIVPSVVLFGAILLLLRGGERGRYTAFLFALLVIAVLLHGLFGSGVSPILSTKIVDLITIVAILFSAPIVMQWSLLQHHFRLLLVLILIASLSAFFLSGVITQARSGSKITPEETSFAFAFKAFDPSLKTALILSPGSTKITQYSNTIPYHILDAYYVPYAAHNVVRDEAYVRALQRKEMWETIVETSCIECIRDLNVTYVVVNRAFFGAPLPYEPVFIYDNFTVYRLQM